jgi:hypothetical protein
VIGCIKAPFLQRRPITEPTRRGISGDAALGIEKGQQVSYLAFEKRLTAAQGFDFQLPHVATGRGILPRELANGACNAEGGGKHHARRESLWEINPSLNQSPKPPAEGRPIPLNCDGGRLDFSVIIGWLSLQLAVRPAFRGVLYWCMTGRMVSARAMIVLINSTWVGESGEALN